MDIASLIFAILAFVVSVSALVISTIISYKSFKHAKNSSDFNAKQLNEQKKTIENNAVISYLMQLNRDLPRLIQESMFCLEIITYETFNSSFENVNKIITNERVILNLINPVGLAWKLKQVFWNRYNESIIGKVVADILKSKNNNRKIEVESINKAFHELFQFSVDFSEEVNRFIEKIILDKIDRSDIFKEK